MAKKLLIIGNGFDIDLGLRTRYSDFAKSKIWEKLMANTYGFDKDLLGELNAAKEKEAWFDIEKTMNDYVRAIRPEYLTTSLVDKDKDSFTEITKALSKYLKDEQQSRNLESNHYAAQILRLIADVGGFEYYTFNYTSLGDIANSCGIKIDTSRITHVHGSLKNDSIILGVLTDPANQIHEQYSFMYKDNIASICQTTCMRILIRQTTLYSLDILSMVWISPISKTFLSSRAAWVGNIRTSISLSLHTMMILTNRYAIAYEMRKWI